MKIWGYSATLAWAFLAFLAGQFIALAVLVWSRLGNLDSLLAAPFDGAGVTLFILIANPIIIAVIVLAVRLKGAPQSDYLALKLPYGRDLKAGIVGLAGLVAVGDVLLYISGREFVTQFQLQSYTTARDEGWLPVLLAGAIIVAPAGEEVLFRGFLFRGWARSERSAGPAIVLISVLWAALHVQYDWTGILQIFIIGLFLGWMRWRSRSTLLTFLLHALFNLEGTIETFAQMRLLF